MKSPLQHWPPGFGPLVPVVAALPVALLFLASWGCITAQDTPPAAASHPASGRAMSLIAAGKFAEAESLLRATIATTPESADDHFLLAYMLLRENKPTESLAEYTLAAKLRAPSAEDLKSVALDYVLLESYPEADRWSSRSVEMNPKDADAWYVLGRIRYERKH